MEMKNKCIMCGEEATTEYNISYPKDKRKAIRVFVCSKNECYEKTKANT